MKTKIQALFLLLIWICILPNANAEEGRYARITELRARLAPDLALSTQELQSTMSTRVHEKYDAASIIADDDERTFLGKIDNTVVNDSIFNDAGQYGSDIASKSIWNDVGRYGGVVARHSPFNDVTSSPPFIVKNGKIIGRLTVNDVLEDAVDPNWLKTFYK